jgi:hypothetical protein
VNKWKLALLWLVPILGWVLWIAWSAHDIESERSAIESESVTPGQNLSACLDFALDDFTTPSPTKRAACMEKHPEDEARVARQKKEHVRRITFDVASDALALAALAAYFRFVPRRFRAGFRVWIVVAIALAVLAAAALFVIASGMPHGD